MAKTKRKKGSHCITDAPRKNMFMELPEDLVLVTDPNHPLYEERVHWEVQESTVLNIMSQGVDTPIIVRKNGGRKLVVAGRQRVKAALEANRRLKAQGKELVRVPTIFERSGDPKDWLGIMISENEIRQNNGPLEKAKLAKKYLKMGGTEEEAANKFGVHVQTIRNWTDITSLAPPVQEAIERGEIKATAASKLARLSDDQQQAKLEELKADGGRITVIKAKNVADGRPAASPKRIRTRKEIESEIARMEGCADESGKGYLQGLKWVLCQ